jgi:hypothetical protein
MNRNLDIDIEWDDPHTHALNKLYTLYQVSMSGLGNLSDIGYRGYPDPRFLESEDDIFTPDFLAIGSDGDAQIIDVKGFNNIEEYLDSRSEVEDKIESVIRELERYDEISSGTVTDYLSGHGVSYEPEHHEQVVLIPNDIYQKYETNVIDAAESVGITVWVLQRNSIEHLWLASGDHRNEKLNEFLELSSGKGIRVYQGGKDLIRFSRDTNRDIVRFYFVANIMAHCAHEGKLKFTFEEIDDILVHKQRPPMYGHLTPPEREEIWIDCIRAMRDRFNLISRLPEIRDTYEWERSRFLRQPRDRYKILQDVGKELGIIEDTQ